MSRTPWNLNRIQLFNAAAVWMEYTPGQTPRKSLPSWLTFKLGLLWAHWDYVITAMWISRTLTKQTFGTSFVRKFLSHCDSHCESQVVTRNRISHARDSDGLYTSREFPIYQVYEWRPFNSMATAMVPAREHNRMVGIGGSVIYRPILLSVTMLDHDKIAKNTLVQPYFISVSHSRVLDIMIVPCWGLCVPIGPVRSARLFIPFNTGSILGKTLAKLGAHLGLQRGIHACTQMCLSLSKVNHQNALWGEKGRKSRNRTVVSNLHECWIFRFPAS